MTLSVRDEDIREEGREEVREEANKKIAEAEAKATEAEAKATEAEAKATEAEAKASKAEEIVAQAIRRLMTLKGTSATEIMDEMEIPADERDKYLARL